MFVCRTLCYPNYFWDNGECKACPSGYFGTNCSKRCPYPYYGKLCKKVCLCNATDCDHVFGCQRNNSEIETATGITKSDVSSTKEKSEYSTTQTELYEKQEKPKHSTPQTKLYDYQGNVKNDNLRIPVIIVGCILIFLIVVYGLKWILKPIRKTGTFELPREDYDPTTEYLEINEIFEQESVSNTISATVTARS
ncbi:uncharacterized protein LOC128157218 [Crassostrea angulata]|uniref:uncharacterized protein LOC128157218 n=1 Tax=Magallana angulata TaxID=2784310 RepID=UPI0022B1C1CF|nr:uncharacterized protein LOC128157218 [Crassostrea angulata]